MSMQKLVPASREAKRILDMLEHGARDRSGGDSVSDALEKGYLRSVMFVVTRPKGGGSTEVETVEEYRFSVKHGDRGEVALDEVQHVGPGGGVSVGLSEHTSKTTRMERLSDLDHIKKAAVSMTRCLLSLVKTLEAVPDGCTFSINLTYVNGTPPDYEPPFFRAACTSGESDWRKNPFSMSVGKVETEYHGLSLRVRSVLDPALDTDSGGAKSNPGSSQTSSLLDQTPSTPIVKSDEIAKAPLVSPELVVSLSQPRIPNAALDSPIVDEDIDLRVLEWIRKQRVGAYVDAVACSKVFRRYPFKAIDAAFGRLLSYGSIAKDGKRGFSVAQAGGKQAQPSAPINDMRKRLRSSKKK
ncbi:DNA-binding HORMA [Ostreococcus tauri]|uniref:DNA-binding HORMA n=1 Tax=Ostreococcus tauri TaxID=70448 RepID=A0A090N3C9_OSTTA|nr:DNA-binding HORMA [Ostreococcus tauri]CEF97898.1 DNA-binding HORMA [Ostreococcus tauri]|eukprot:XP_022838953.1 DNA-binding HORMA [Ostreococcus tauri]